MLQVKRLTASIVALIAIGASALVVIDTFAAEQLTAAQKAQLQFFGVDPNVMKGDELLKQLSGGCDYNPYEILERYKSGQNVQITPRVSNGGTQTGGINSALACRLTKLLKAAEERGCRPKLSSAYRSAQQQESMCGGGRSGCAPAGKSCHQYGLAVDVTSSCTGWLRMAAPQFQLVFPYYGDHIQCAEHRVASCSPSTPPCNGSVAIQPDLSRLPRPDQVPETYFVQPSASAPPTSALANQFRQSLGMQTQPTASPTTNNPTSQQTVSPAVSQEPTPLLPQPTQSQFCVPEYKCSGSTLMYQNSSCTMQPVQACTSGCAAGACIISNATSTATTTQGTNVGVEKPRASSTLEMLEFMSGAQATAVEVGTSTPLQLLLGLSTDQVSTGNPVASSSSTKPIVGPPGSGLLVTAQQTFVSSDLSQNVPVYQQQPIAQTSTLFVALEQLKQVLLWTLSYIQPFSPQRYNAHLHAE